MYLCRFMTRQQLLPGPIFDARSTTRKSQLRKLKQHLTSMHTKRAHVSQKDSMAPQPTRALMHILDLLLELAIQQHPDCTQHLLDDVPGRISLY